ncbi:serine/threonine-protein phosphatase 1 regulatory subunit 10-like isoform X3 [Sycon ciliatum]|uniref:serine/threonine-protein phosphatase 1 regulatory subunit 10-like isoform X3 n=1 Tax=Sycon ciliatum TaxID=27933 RepID=UPI0031F6375A
MATTEMNVLTPEKYLEELSPFLGQTGCIKSAHDVDKIISRMEDPTLLLVSKSILTSAVRATKAPSTLEKFMSSGGWAILNTWLENSMKKGEENYPFIVCLLDVLRKLPVTVEYLQQGNFGKLVKQLKKADDEEASTAASGLLKEWLLVVKKHQNPSSSKEALEKKRKLEEEKKAAAAALGPISASVRAKEKEVAKPTAKPKSRKTKKKADDGKVDEPAEKKSKPADLAKPGEVVKKEKVKSPTAPPVESAGFMNALSSANLPKARMRKKSVPPPNQKNPKAGAGTGVKMDTEDVPGDRSATAGGSAETSSQQQQQQDVDDGAQMETHEAMDTSVPHPPMPVPSSYSGAGVLVYPGQRNRKKKRVTWAPAETMRDVYFFEIEEGERVNMHAKNFLDIAKMEKEKEALALRTFRSEAVESIPWRLVPISRDTPALVSPGFKSSEKIKQERREQSTLAFLFLSKASLPDTPGEPEPEMSDSSRSFAEPKLIPILDESDPGLPTGAVAPGIPAAVTAPAAYAGDVVGMQGAQLPVATAPAAAAAPAAHPVPGLDSTQTQASVQDLLDKLKTKGMISAEGAAGQQQQPGGMIPPGPGMQQPHFAGQPVPNRPPGPGIGPPGNQPMPGGPGGMAPMFDGGMPPPHPGMMPPPGMPSHEGSFPPQHGGAPPQYVPQQDGPPPMGHAGGGNWRPMGPGGPAPVGGPALLPTPSGPQAPPMPSGYQEEYIDGGNNGGGNNGGGGGSGGGGGGGGRPDYPVEMDYHDDYDSRPRGRGGYRGRRGGRGRGGASSVPCRHYMSPRGCTMGDNCRFLHPAPGSLDNWDNGAQHSGGGGYEYDRPPHTNAGPPPFRGGRAGGGGGAGGGGSAGPYHAAAPGGGSMPPQLPPHHHHEPGSSGAVGDMPMVHGQQFPHNQPPSQELPQQQQQQQQQQPPLMDMRPPATLAAYPPTQQPLGEARDPQPLALPPASSISSLSEPSGMHSASTLVDPVRSAARTGAVGAIPEIVSHQQQQQSAAVDDTGGSAEPAPPNTGSGALQHTDTPPGTSARPPDTAGSTAATATASSLGSRSAASGADDTNLPNVAATATAVPSDSALSHSATTAATAIRSTASSAAADSAGMGSMHESSDQTKHHSAAAVQPAATGHASVADDRASSVCDAVSAPSQEAVAATHAHAHAPGAAAALVGDEPEVHVGREQRQAASPLPPVSNTDTSASGAATDTGVLPSLADTAVDAPPSPTRTAE